jgi:hypothetical protein
MEMRPVMAMAAMRNNGLTIRRLRVRTMPLRVLTRRREPIPRPAAAIPLRHGLTPHPATVGEGAPIAAEVAAIAVAGAAVVVAIVAAEVRTVAEAVLAVVEVRTVAAVEAVEVHMAVEEAPALTATTNLF